ncbi:hypothetical protein AGMMS50212_07320 [Spirochaetia bacterium]|nr:hypothetical protein AGMMS50212_07320 [Spirochaetia bacterium]
MYSGIFCIYPLRITDNCIGMISSELFFVLKNVITSWQVIIAAIAVLIYFKMVFSAANPRPKIKAAQKPKKIKRPPTQPAQIDKDVDAGDLNLE